MSPALSSRAWRWVEWLTLTLLAGASLVAAVLVIRTATHGPVSRSYGPAVRASQHGIALHDIPALPPHSRARFGSLLARHGAPVYALATSDDGKQVASIDFEHALRLWSEDGTLRFSTPPPAATVHALAFSPEGRWLVVGDDDGRLHVWQTSPPKLRFQLDAHRESWFRSLGRDVSQVAGYGDVAFRGWVAALAFTPDGTLCFSGGGDGRLVGWNLAQGRLLWQADGHRGAVRDLAVSPDGQTLATGGDDGAVRFWDVRTGSDVRPSVTRPGRVLDLDWNPNGHALWAAPWKDGVALSIPRGRRDRPLAVSLRTAGTTDNIRLSAAADLAWFETAARIDFRRLSTGERLTLPNSSSYDTHWHGPLVLSRDSRRALTLLDPGRSTWGWRELRAPVLTRGNPGASPVVGGMWVAAGLSPDGSLLAGIDDAANLRFWQLDPPRAQSETRLARPARGIRFLRSGALAITIAPDVQQPWAIEAVELCNPDGTTSAPPANLTAAKCLTYTWDGRMLAWLTTPEQASPAAATVHVLSATDASLHAIIALPWPHVARAALSSNGRALAVLGMPDPQSAPAGELAIYHWQELAPEERSASREPVLRVPIANTRSVRWNFTRDGKGLIVVGRLEPSSAAPLDWRLLNLADGTVVSSGQADLDQATWIPTSRYGDWLAVAGRRGDPPQSRDGILQFSTQNGQLLREFLAPIRDRMHWTAAFSADARWLACGSARGDVQLIDTDNGQVVRTWTAHDRWIGPLAFDPAGERLASAASDGRVAIWEVASGRALHNERAHRGNVALLQWSTDGQSLLSCGTDSTAVLWKSAAPRPSTPP